MNYCKRCGGPEPVMCVSCTIEKDAADRVQRHGEHQLYEPYGYAGIAACRVCGGAEASLPRECPGAKMSPEDQEAVQDGNLEFMHGRWWAPKGRAL